MKKTKLFSSLSVIMNCRILDGKSRRAPAGAALGLLCFLVFGLVYVRWKWAFLFLAAFSLAGVLRLDFRQRWVNAALKALWLLVFLAFFLLLPYLELLPGQTAYALSLARQNLASSIMGINALLLVTVLLLAFVLCCDIRGAVLTAAVLLSGYVSANGFVYRFRGKELIFPDILAAGTALNVAGNYDFYLPFDSFRLLAIAAFLVFAGFALPGGCRRRLRARVSALLAALVCLTVAFPKAKGINCVTWDRDGSLLRGGYLNFCLSVRDNFVDKPEGYDPKALEVLYQQYASPDAPQEELPHVLVIMSEAYADFDRFGTELQTNVPVSPFYDALEENTIRGHALCSTYGGGTANSEFELLTGFTMSFLPGGTSPYQQYINREMYALPAYLDSLGYHCLATHPYLANGWNRPKVYPLLGFEELCFQEAYPGEDRIRDFISDQEMFGFLLDRLTDAEQPQFIFGITMQNHGGYSGTLEERTVSLEGLEGSYPDVEEYLSLMQYSDRALETLIHGLEDLERDTVLLFFGDHFPSVNKAFYQELNGGALEGLNGQLLLHQVPFFIWANYDIPEQQVACTSLNYLGRHLLETAGLELPPWYQFLKELEQEIPAVSAMGYYSRRAGDFIPLEEAKGEEALWLSRYRQLQYNGMFDREKSGFFTLERDTPSR